MNDISDEKQMNKGISIIFVVISFVFLLVTYAVSLSMFEGEFLLSMSWQRFLGGLACIYMIFSTNIIIRYRHSQGEVYNLKNASKKRTFGFVLFIVLNSLLTIYYLLSPYYEKFMSICMAIFLYLGGYLTYKYIRVKAHEKDFGYIIILFCFCLTYMVILKFLQVCFRLNITLGY